MWAQVTAISVFTFGACTVVAYVIVPVFFFVVLVVFFCVVLVSVVAYVIELVSIAVLYSKCTRTLTFENFCKPSIMGKCTRALTFVCRVNVLGH